MEVEKTIGTPKEIEDTLAEQHRMLRQLESTLAQFKTTIEKLEGRMEEVYRKSVATCDDCSIDFDLFSHHYSIGLFDNIVYVKCPRCQKAFPVDQKSGVMKEQAKKE